MERNGRPRRRPEAPSAPPTTITELARRYHSCAVALATSLGLPMTEAFLRDHRESVSSIFIAADRAGVRLTPAVQLPPLTAPPVEAPAEAGEIMCSGRPPAPEAPTTGQASPVAIPTDAGLPCAGQLLVDLKPAPLSMLIGKVGRLAEAQGGRWTVLLAALQAERAARLDKGRKPRRPDPDLDPVGHVEVPEGADDVP